MEYYTTEVLLEAYSIDPADAGVMLEEPFIQVKYGDEREPLEGTLDPSVIAQDGTEVMFSIPMEPVDGKGRTIRLTYCLVSPEGRIYYSWVDIAMNDAQTVYNLNVLDLLRQNSEESGGTVSAGNWTAVASVEGVLIGKAAFSID